MDIRIDAYIPENYISNQAQRVDCYRKIARIQTEEDSYDITDELIDRYGDPPRSVLGLIDVARLRNMAQAVDITEITQNDDVIKFYISKFNMERIANVSDTVGNRMQLETMGRAHISVKLGKGDKPLDLMRTVITAMNSI